MRLERGFALIVIVATGLACTGVSDTGYTGTWSRQERGVSTLAIVHAGDTPRVRWQFDAADGSSRVRCDWEGRCEGWAGDEKVADYSFRSWFDPESRNLRVECTGTILTLEEEQPKEREIHYIDELVLGRDGLELWAYTLEESGQTYEVGARPERILTKTSDDVSDPP